VPVAGNRERHVSARRCAAGRARRPRRSARAAACRAPRGRSASAAIAPASRILMLNLVAEVSTPAELSMSRCHQAAAERVLDPGGLVSPRLRLGTTGPARTRHRTRTASLDRSPRRRASRATPSRRCRCRRSTAGRPAPAGSLRSARRATGRQPPRPGERRGGLRGDRHPDFADRGQTPRQRRQRRVVVRPRRAGQVEQPLPLREAGRRVRAGSREYVGGDRIAATSFSAATAACRCRTRHRTCTDADGVKSSVSGSVLSARSASQTTPRRRGR